MAKAKSPKTTSIRSKKNGKPNGAPMVGVDTPASAEPATQAEKMAASSAPQMPEQQMPEQTMPQQKPAPKLSAAEPLPAAAKDLESAIRQRAYQIFLERHGAPGNPQEDWARAEREVKEAFAHQKSA